MPRVAVLTSGGDAPGMNAAIRAVVRAGIAKGFEVAAIHHGFTGLIEGDFRAVGARDVGGIIQRGGTILGTTRCEALRTEQGCAAAVAALQAQDIAALIVIGGNGSQTGSWELSRRGAPVIGVASTIDNDLYGADPSLGATTAIDVALEAIDKLRVTAAAMRRAFLVEVMGRHCGYLALAAGIAGGAEAIIVPESDAAPADVADELCAAYARGKSHAIAVVAEGARYNARALLDYFHEHKNRLGFELRATTLGHVQRGGSPGVFDRMAGTLLGVAAVDSVIERRHGVLIGIRDGKPQSTPLETVAGKTRPADPRLIALAHMLAR